MTFYSSTITYTRNTHNSNGEFIQNKNSDRKVKEAYSHLALHMLSHSEKKTLQKIKAECDSYCEQEQEDLISVKEISSALAMLVHVGHAKAHQELY